MVPMSWRRRVYRFRFDALAPDFPCFAFPSEPPASPSAALAAAFFFFALRFAPFDLLLLPPRGDSGGGEGEANSSCSTAVMSTSCAKGSWKVPTNPVQPPMLLIGPSERGEWEREKAGSRNASKQ